MNRVTEYEVWSAPGTLLDAEYGKKCLAEEARAAGIPKEVFLGLSFIPDKLDCEYLATTIERGETSESEYLDFCKKNQLAPDLDSEESAAKFLEFKDGRCLAWIHFPEHGDPGLLSRLKSFVATRNLRMVAV